MNRKCGGRAGGDARVHAFDLKDGALTKTDRLFDSGKLPLEELIRKHPEAAKVSAEEPVRQLPSVTDAKSFKSGLTFDEKAGLLYSLDINAGSISAIPVGGRRQATKTEVIGGRPYDVAIDPRRTLIYVSDWAGKQVLVLDPESLKVIRKIAVGERPNQMALHPTDGRLFVACASSNCVSVNDTRRGTVVETIYTSLFPKAPAGTTPCTLVVASDGATLYVANADNNCVAVIDVEQSRRSQVKGVIPTGWYPTAVRSRSSSPRTTRR